MRQARSAGQLPVRAQAGNSARPITGQQQQMMNSQRIMQGTVPLPCFIVSQRMILRLCDSQHGPENPMLCNWQIACSTPVNFSVLMRISYRLVRIVEWA